MRYIDLHLHLDGAISVDIAKKLAELQGIDLPASTDEELQNLLAVSPDCTDLNEFLKRFDLPCSLMQTAEGISLATQLVLEELARQGVVYAELRFAPQFHCSKGLTQREVVEAALAGIRAVTAGVAGVAGVVNEPAEANAPTAPRIKANLILCCMRGPAGPENEAANRETLAVAKELLVEDGGVVAIDLAGAEGLFPTAQYADLFAEAVAGHVPFTLHAGEADGADSVRQALAFGAARIGHGVRAGEDPALVEELARRGVALEMCPTSNRITHAVASMADYPLADFLERGLKVTLNTDDPVVVNSTIEKEFLYAREVLGVTVEQERRMVANSIDAAFTTDAVKAELRQLLLEEQA